MAKQPELTEDQLKKVRAAYEQEGKIPAVRQVMDHLSLGIADAKRFVERTADRQKWELG